MRFPWKCKRDNFKKKIVSRVLDFHGDKNLNLEAKMGHEERRDSSDERLERIERKLDAVLAMLEPVHSHAEWVDGLRARLHSIGLMRNTPRIE